MSFWLNVNWKCTLKVWTHGNFFCVQLFTEKCMLWKSKLKEPDCSEVWSDKWMSYEILPKAKYWKDTDHNQSTVYNRKDGNCLWKECLISNMESLKRVTIVWSQSGFSVNQYLGFLSGWMRILYLPKTLPSNRKEWLECGTLEMCQTYAHDRLKNEVADALHGYTLTTLYIKSYLKCSEKECDGCDSRFTAKMITGKWKDKYARYLFSHKYLSFICLGKIKKFMDHEIA